MEEQRNQALCQGCGILIFYGKDRKNDPPKLCPQCQLTNASALDLNPLKIVNQFYVQNEKVENEVMLLTDRDEVKVDNLNHLEPKIETEPEFEKPHKRKLRRNSI